MIDFNKEIKKFKPSIEIANIQKEIEDMDLTDMKDINIMLMKEIVKENI
ncbi:MAG: hypothetical protein Q4F88_01845 [Eubacteriales bacterium]|nr:hypothetical protein [Eubacteriales bacterium]